MFGLIGMYKVCIKSASHLRQKLGLASTRQNPALARGQEALAWG